MPGAESSGIVLFAAELKAQRTRLGWTQAELGDKIGFSGSFVSDVERSERTPRIDFARACDREMSLPGSLERMHELVRNAAYPSFFAPVIPFEREAVRIHGFELGSVPGLLQTETYARALIRATRPHDKDADIERLVAARLERQEIMSKDSPPLLWYVLDGPISVYEFSGAPSVCYTECNRGGRVIEDHAEVAEMMTKVNMIRVSALSPRASVDLMREIRSQLDDQQ
jgi:transcriptional regulator with XRE-family HTH domain